MSHTLPRKVFFLLVLCVGIWGTVYLYNHLADGFSMRQISSSLPPYPQFEVPLSQERREELTRALQQPFFYMGKGCQFYAFVSEDGRYVLKFLKHKHLRPCTWMRSLPLPSGFRHIGEAKIARRQQRVERLFASCKLAYEEMPEETGLLYIHLNRVPALETQVTLVDKLGLRHCLYLDHYEYVIQERAISVGEAYAQAGSEAEKQALLDQLIGLVCRRCGKGIADRDRSFAQNVAFCRREPRALFIDTGQFYKDEGIQTPEAQRTDLRKRLGDLRFWAERHAPDWVSLIDHTWSSLE